MSVGAVLSAVRVIKKERVEQIEPLIITQVLSLGMFFILLFCELAYSCSRSIFCIIYSLDIYLLYFRVKICSKSVLICCHVVFF